jgi:hypothetical protein
MGSEESGGGIWISRLALQGDGRLLDERHPLVHDGTHIVGLPSADGGRGVVVSVHGALRFYPLTEYSGL